MNYVEVLYDKLKSSGKDNFLKRFNHSLGVSVTCLKVAESNNLDVDLDKLFIAGLLHDYAKYTTLEEYDRILTKNGLDKECLDENIKVLHGICGYLIVQEELGINDLDILNAIKYHVFGKDNMSVYEELVYLSDFIEPNREGEFYDEIRKYAFSDYKKAIGIASYKLIKHLESKNDKIHKNAYITYEYYKKFM